MRKVIELYRGSVIATNPEDFEADLYREDDTKRPFAMGTFYKRIISKEDLPKCTVGGQFIFEIYRENGDIKWSIAFTNEHPISTNH